MTTVNKSTKSHPDMLTWQYRNILSELSHITLHSQDDTCPCNQVDYNLNGKALPEYCLGKHLLTVSSLASETSLMDPAHSDMLDDLSSEALEFHNKAKEIYCKGGTWPDLPTWSREARKQIEPIYYACNTKGRAKLHDSADLAAPETPYSQSRLCFGLEQAYKKLQGIDRSLGQARSTVAKIKKDMDTPGLICKGQAEMMDSSSRKDLFGSRCRDPKTGVWTEASDCGFKPEGAKTEAISGNGRDRYMFEHVVTELNNLVVSNNPITFEIDPRFPKELQPRMRERKASRVQVEKISADIIPDALITDFHSLDRGSPIIGPDLVVEAGNGRVMAMQLAAKNFPQSWKRYIDRLEERVAEFGISVKDMKKLEKPVLVRLRLTDVDRVAFSKSTNTSTVMVPSSIEVAKIDAEEITLDMIKDLTVLENESIEDALKASRNSSFAMRFMKKLPENEQANIVDAKGILNRDGVQRMTMALFVSAFPGDTGVKLAEKAFETIDQDVKNTVNALARSLGPLAESEALIRRGQREASLSIAGDISQSVMIYSKIRNAPELTVEKYFAQSQMFGKELSPIQEKILLTIDKYRRSPNRLAAVFSGYARAVIAQPPPGQGSLMAFTQATKEQLWDNADKTVGEELELEKAQATTKRTKERELVAAMGEPGQMSRSTSVQTGLPGMESKKGYQAKAFEEFGTAPGSGGQKNPLIDISKLPKKAPSGQALLFASMAIPKSIEVYPYAIIKHFRNGSALHKGSIRSSKKDSRILLVLGCPVDAKWDSDKSTCKPQQVVLMTQVPNNPKYRTELVRLINKHPEIPVKYYSDGHNSNHSDVNDVEQGFTVCELANGDLVTGPRSSGSKSSVSVTVECPIGSKPVAIAHNHPSGNLEASEKDKEAARIFGIPVCATTSDGKKIKCHK